MKNEIPFLDVLNRKYTFKSFLSYIYSGNPFYLLSAAILLYATSSWFDASALTVPRIIPLGIIALYTLLLAATCVGLARLGKVWDDAGTLYRLILILLMILPVCSDSEMLDSLQISLIRTGGSLLFALFVLECIRHLLGYFLHRRFLIPFLIGLIYLFLYPALVAALVRAGLPQKIVFYSIQIFSCLGGVLLFEFLPAVLKGCVGEKNEIPWKTPFYPWCFAALLSIGIMCRVYLLLFSFIGGKGTGGYSSINTGFSLSMIVPPAFAFLILLTELLLRINTEKSRNFLILLPGFLFILNFSKPDWQSPLTWIAVGSFLIFLIYQRFRGVRHGLLWIALCAYCAWGFYKETMQPWQNFGCLAVVMGLLIGWFFTDTKRSFPVLLIVACGYLLCGIWLDPKLVVPFNWYVPTCAAFWIYCGISRKEETIRYFVHVILLLFSVGVMHGCGMTGNPGFLIAFLLGWGSTLIRRNAIQWIFFILYTLVFCIFTAVSIKDHIANWYVSLEKAENYLWALLFFLIALGVSLHKAWRNRKKVTGENLEIQTLPEEKTKEK
ncbi:MAG: hypothetical protein J6W81_04100 [Lentisphaeria bacterium]|nr:hypothetical protein [Lentisphaeria bacterium]